MLDSRKVPEKCYTTVLEYMHLVTFHHYQYEHCITQPVFNIFEFAN